MVKTWLVTFGTTGVLVHAASASAARESAVARYRLRFAGTILDPIEANARRATASDLLAFAEAGATDVLAETPGVNEAGLDYAAAL